LTQKPQLPDQHSTNKLNSKSHDTATSDDVSSVNSQAHGGDNVCRDDTNNNNNNTSHSNAEVPRPVNTTCGIVALLECIPQIPIKQPKKRKRLLKRIKEFNKRAEDARKKNLKEEKFYCHQPSELPLKLNFNTRVAFAYELTRIVFCIDASPTLTSTFGNTGHVDGAICAMDRLGKMVQMFFNGLVQPIAGAAVKRSGIYNGNGDQVDTTTSHDSPWWVPELAVTVIAVFPPAMTREGEKPINVLVADYSVQDVASANRLADEIIEWAAVEVESEIAARLGRVGGRLDCSSSCLKDIVEKCDEALLTLPSRGRPVIVLATDCRAIECESILDFAKDRNMRDTPLNVLDLSGSHSHRTGVSLAHEGPNYLTFDADGPSSFPLIIPDDSLHLYNICISTRGYFIDSERLQDAVNTYAGDVDPSSPFYQDVYFSVRRRVVNPNALQWHTIFSLSPCCPFLNASWGNMPPPFHVLERHQIAAKQVVSNKAMFFSYPLNPVRVKGVLIMRIIDGYRPRRYGTSSQDDDKVSIQFSMKLELGTILHYEFSYVASPFHNAMVGSAYVKISLSGEPSFVQMIKSEYIGNQFSSNRSRAMTLREKACNRICEYLKWIRQEDILESKICPLDWGDNLIKGSNFLRDISLLENIQLHRHFRYESFEVLCTSGDTIQYFIDNSQRYTSSEIYKYLVEAVSVWSTQTIIEGRLYLRQLPTLDGNLTHYCLIEVKFTELLRVFSVHLYFFEQIDAETRFNSMKSLQSTITTHNAAFVIASKPVSERVLSNTIRRQNGDLQKLNNANIMQQSESWELLRELELLALVAKRRSYFDNFLPLVLDDEQTILIKFEKNSCNRIYLVQYHLNMLHDNAQARIYMDMEHGVFCHAILDEFYNTQGTFQDIYSNMKERDHKCARALRSRRNLLDLLSASHDRTSLDYTDDVQRLLLYASGTSKKLRFFDEIFSKANSVLEKLTVEFMLSGSFNANVTEIPVTESQTIEGMDSGRWFLMRHDSEMFSIIYLPFQQIIEIADTGEDRLHYRELCFFTVAFADLYYYKTDVQMESDPSQQNSSRYLINLFNDLEIAHRHHFSCAAYRALRQNSDIDDYEFSRCDFQQVMSCCKMERVVEGIDIFPLVGSNDDTRTSHSKLTRLLSGLLCPIPGGLPYFYFIGEEENPAMNSFLDDSSCCTSTFSSDTDQNNSYTTGKYSRSHDIVAPLFILITIDGQASTLHDIETKKTSYTLSLFITVFKSDVYGRKSTLHQSATSKLISNLNSYVAEQTLEQLLWEKMQMGNVDIEAVKLCLMEANNVITMKVPLQFYRPNTDSMVDVTDSIGLKEGLQSCFYLLGSFLVEQQFMKIEESSGGDFFAVDISSHGWCWIAVPENIGPVLIYVFHHHGLEAADRIARQASEVVTKECHRVNQFLLLESMQKSRAASDLLLAPDSTLKDNDASEYNHNDDIVDHTTVLAAGHFQCDIAYQAFYKLNRRFLPSKALHDLEYSVLHSFAVSNRRGIFVYKDEQQNIFYMKFEPRENRTDPSKYGIAFFVYGIKPAGASITKQLDCLIKKKLMTLYVETISTELTKSQHFDLSQSDLEFIKSFEETWQSLENGTSSSESHEEFYEYPLHVYDPVLVLLCFRQNISGSTFFNIWSENTTQSSQSEDKEKSLTNNDTECNYTVRNGADFTFDHNDFSLCYNATQFQLNPEFQAVSTLTEKGKDFSRKAGTGIALIEIKLLDPKDFSRQISEISVGKIPKEKINHLQLLDNLSFRRLTKEEVVRSQDQGQLRISVRIYNTTLDVEAVYRWIELTLNQALVSWVVERYLEKASLGPFEQSEDPRSCNGLQQMGKLCPGLPAFTRILSKCETLPHPGIKHIRLQWCANSVDVASLTLECFERVILASLYDKKRVDAQDVTGLEVLRFVDGKSEFVNIKQAEPAKAFVVNKDNLMVIDKPIDSPTYAVVYGLHRETEVMRRIGQEKRTHPKGAPPFSSFLFQKVSIDDFLAKDTPGSLSNALKTVLLKKPCVFMRRISFLLFVSRTGISALFYNFNPITIESIKSKLEEIHSDVDKHHHQENKLNRSRYFKRLPVASKVDINTASSANAKGTKRAQAKTEKPNVNSIPEERVSSPTGMEEKKRSIMIPTIVGKSVKGSAQQALLHSRQRARVNPKIVSTTKFTSPKGRDNTSTKLATKSPAHSQQEKIVRPTEIRNYLPAQLQKDILSLLAFLASRSLRGSQTNVLYQTIFCNWFLNLNGKEMSFLAMESILRNATAIKTTFFPIVSSAVEYPTPFILYFAKNMFPETVTILSRNFIFDDSNRDIVNPSIFIMHEVMKSNHFQIYSIHEVGIKSIQGFGKLGFVRSWLIYSSNDKVQKMWDVGVNDPAINFRRKNSIRCREAESNSISKISHLALLCLQPQLKMFMFSVNLLRQAVKGNIDRNISIINLLHEVLTVFPNTIQQKKEIGVWYRLLHRTIGCNQTTDVSDNVDDILRFVASKSQVYGITNCPDEQICISGPVITTRNCSASSSDHLCICNDLAPQSKSYLPSSVNFFVHLGQNSTENKLRLEIFALCCANGIAMERYVFEDSSSFAKKMSDYILDTTEATVCDLIIRASVDMKRESLWNKYAIAHLAKEKKGCSSICMYDELQELNSLSLTRELSELDPRLMEIVSLSEVDLEVSELMNAIIDDERIHHYYVFEGQNDNSITYLLYVIEVNIFVVFVINKQQHLSKCTMIARNGTGIDTNISVESLKFVVDLIGTVTFRWIWNNT